MHLDNKEADSTGDVFNKFEPPKKFLVLPSFLSGFFLGVNNFLLGLIAF